MTINLTDKELSLISLLLNDFQADPLIVFDNMNYPDEYEKEEMTKCGDVLLKRIREVGRNNNLATF